LSDFFGVQLGVHRNCAQARDPAGKQGFKKRCPVFHANHHPAAWRQAQVLHHESSQRMTACGKFREAERMTAASHRRQMRVTAGAVQKSMNCVHTSYSNK